MVGSLSSSDLSKAIHYFALASHWWKIASLENSVEKIDWNNTDDKYEILAASATYGWSTIKAHQRVAVAS